MKALVAPVPPYSDMIHSFESLDLGKQLILILWKRECTTIVLNGILGFDDRHVPSNTLYEVVVDMSENMPASFQMIHINMLTLKCIYSAIFTDPGALSTIAV